MSHLCFSSPTSVCEQSRAIEPSPHRASCRIRELTNHAVEMFALKALQGEVILDEDPFTIPQVATATLTSICRGLRTSKGCSFGEIAQQCLLCCCAIPQAGYCHDWDCHGGSAWLHQHMMNNYVYCWQQGLSNGEIDGSVCDIGTSRWFNYYLEGLRRSVESPPHMDGIYCKRPANHDAPFHDSPMILCASVL